MLPELTLTDLDNLSVLFALLAKSPKKEAWPALNVAQDSMNKEEESVLLAGLALTMIKLANLNAKLAQEVQFLSLEKLLVICANLVLTLWTVCNAIIVLLDNIQLKLELLNANHALLELLLLVELPVAKDALKALMKLTMSCVPSAGDSVLLAK